MSSSFTRNRILLTSLDLWMGGMFKRNSPSHAGSLFHTCKQHSSIVLEGLTDTPCKFIAIDVGAYERQSHGGIFATQIKGPTYKMEHWIFLHQLSSKLKFSFTLMLLWVMRYVPFKIFYTPLSKAGFIW